MIVVLLPLLGLAKRREKTAENFKLVKIKRLVRLDWLDACQAHFVLARELLLVGVFLVVARLVFLRVVVVVTFQSETVFADH